MIQTQKGFNGFSTQYTVATTKIMTQYVLIFQDVFAGYDLFEGQSDYKLKTHIDKLCSFYSLLVFEITIFNNSFNPSFTPTS